MSIFHKMLNVVIPSERRDKARVNMPDKHFIILTDSLNRIHNFSPLIGIIPF